MLTLFQNIEGTAKAGKVDCTQERQLCQQASVNSYPTVRFYTGSNNGNPQVSQNFF
jgi:hypothetical protein